MGAGPPSAAEPLYQYGSSAAATGPVPPIASSSGSRQLPEQALPAGPTDHAGPGTALLHAIPPRGAAPPPPQGSTSEPYPPTRGPPDQAYQMARGPTPLPPRSIPKAPPVPPSSYTSTSR
ncbi:hypothetical protein MRX96_035989 [Rhipicephalus microplus]